MSVAEADDTHAAPEFTVTKSELVQFVKALRQELKRGGAPRPSYVSEDIAYLKATRETILSHLRHVLPDDIITSLDVDKALQLWKNAFEEEAPESDAAEEFDADLQLDGADYIAAPETAAAPRSARPDTSDYTLNMESLRGALLEASDLKTGGPLGAARYWTEILQEAWQALLRVPVHLPRHHVVLSYRLQRYGFTESDTKSFYHLKWGMIAPDKWKRSLRMAPISAKDEIVEMLEHLEATVTLRPDDPMWSDLRIAVRDELSHLPADLPDKVYVAAKLFIWEKLAEGVRGLLEASLAGPGLGRGPVSGSTGSEVLRRAVADLPSRLNLMLNRECVTAMYLSRGPPRYGGPSGAWTGTRTQWGGPSGGSGPIGRAKGTDAAAGPRRRFTPARDLLTDEMYETLRRQGVSANAFLDLRRIEGKPLTGLRVPSAEERTHPERLGLPREPAQRAQARAKEECDRLKSGE